MALIFSDNFTGTTIDTGKWTVVDGTKFSQNNQLIITVGTRTNIGDDVDYLKSVSTVTSGTAVVQATLNWGTAAQPANDGFPRLKLWFDANNNIQIVDRAATPLGGFRMLIKSGGLIVYDVDTGIGADNTLWKITYDTSSHDIKYWYWNGSAWTQTGTTQNINFGSTVYCTCEWSDSITFSGGPSTYTFDDLYFSDADYSTQYPVTATNSNFFMFM